MSPKKILYNKVTNKSETRTFRLKTEWEENYFHLFIMDSTFCWFALVTPEHIRKLAELHEINYETYFENLYKYICNKIANFSFDIEDNKFIIYREIENEDLQIKYFFVDLEQVNYQNTVETLFDELVDTCNNLTQKQNILSEEYNKATSEKLLYESKCSEYIQLKNKSEVQMYSSFIALLNEKKHRIQFLTELLDEYQSGRKRKFNEEQPQASTSRERETISDSDTNLSEEYNTDDEKKNSKNEVNNDSLDFLDEHSPPPPQLTKRIKNNSSASSLNVPSTSKTNTALEVKSYLIPQQEAVSLKLEDDFVDDSDEEMKLNTQELLDRM